MLPPRGIVPIGSSKIRPRKAFKMKRVFTYHSVSSSEVLQGPFHHKRDKEEGRKPKDDL